MKISNILTAAALIGLLSACSLPHTDMKSPCAGAEGSPCDHRPVNDWWMNPHQGDNT
jgi:hypothetical protein